MAVSETLRRAPKGLIWLCTWVLLLAQTAIAESESSNYNQGITAYKEGAFQQAFAAWSLAAYEGHTEAQYNLGVLYLEGLGISRNLEQAHAWFKRAAEKDHVEAQYNLGHMALSGMATEKSIEQALQWWERAARGGYAPAQFNYGRALFLGVAGIEDKTVGLEYIQRAAEQDDQRAVKFLAENTEEANATVKSSPVAAAHANSQLQEDSGGENVRVEQRFDTEKRVPAEAPAGVPASADSVPEEGSQVITGEEVAPPQGEASSERDEVKPGATAAMGLNEVTEPEEHVESAAELRARPETDRSAGDVNQEVDPLEGGDSQQVQASAGELDTVAARDDTPEPTSGTNEEALVEGEREVDSTEAATPAVDRVPGGELQIIQKSYLMRTVDLPVTMFAEPGLQTPVAELAPVSLVRVRGILGNRLQVQSANLPGQRNWIAADDLAYTGESAQQLQEAWKQALGEFEPARGSKTSEQSGRSAARPGGSEPVAEERGNSDPPSNVRLNDNLWLFVQEENTHVIKLFSIRNHEKAEQIASESRFREIGHLYTTLISNERWSFLLLGPYAGRAEAGEALGQLPAHYRNGAQISPVSRIAQKRCAKRESLYSEQAKGLDVYCLD